MDVEWRARAGELRTIPNLVSLSRLPLLLAIAFLLDSVWRYPLFALIILSDGLDGWLARRLDQKTELGAMLDPALDKLTALVLFVVLFPRTGLPVEYLALFFARDAFVVSLGPLVPLYGFDTSKVQARKLGKVVTNLQFWTMVAMLVPHVPATRALMWALGAASALAIADYVVFVSRELSDREWIHTRGAAVAAAVGVGLAFAAVVGLLLPGEFRTLLSWLGSLL
jgi:phosphatidylglycerophosphate synthase